MAYRFLKSGKAKSHFYNAGIRLSIDHFHQFYCYLFVEVKNNYFFHILHRYDIGNFVQFQFDRQWCKAQPKSIMDFSSIQTAFESEILYALQNEKCSFKVNVNIENI